MYKLLTIRECYYLWIRLFSSYHMRYKGLKKISHLNTCFNEAFILCEAWSTWLELKAASGCLCTVLSINPYQTELWVEQKVKRTSLYFLSDFSKLLLDIAYYCTSVIICLSAFDVRELLLVEEKTRFKILTCINC